MNKSTNTASLLTLLLANSLTLVMFVFFGGSILQVLWIYWTQSVIIGLVNVYRLLSASHMGFTIINGESSINMAHSLDRKGSGIGFLFTKIFYAGFFIVHYGGFHFIYAVFLAQESGVTNILGNEVTGSAPLLAAGGVSILAVIINGAVFAVHHILSLLDEDEESKGLMVRLNKPYSRILPMHLIIMLGPLVMSATGSPGFVFALFIALKAYTDFELFKKKVSHPNPVIVPN